MGSLTICSDAQLAVADCALVRRTRSQAARQRRKMRIFCAGLRRGMIIPNGPPGLAIQDSICSEKASWDLNYSQSSKSLPIEKTQPETMQRRHVLLQQDCSAAFSSDLLHQRHFGTPRSSRSQVRNPVPSPALYLRQKNFEQGKLSEDLSNLSAKSEKSQVRNPVPSPALYLQQKNFEQGELSEDLFNPSAKSVPIQIPKGSSQCNFCTDIEGKAALQVLEEFIAGQRVQTDSIICFPSLPFSTLEDAVQLSQVSFLHGLCLQHPAVINGDRRLTALRSFLDNNSQYYL